MRKQIALYSCLQRRQQLRCLQFGLYDAELAELTVSAEVKECQLESKEDTERRDSSSAARCEYVCTSEREGPAANTASGRTSVHGLCYRVGVLCLERLLVGRYVRRCPSCLLFFFGSLEPDVAASACLECRDGPEPRKVLRQVLQSARELVDRDVVGWDCHAESGGWAWTGRAVRSGCVLS